MARRLRVLIWSLIGILTIGSAGAVLAEPFWQSIFQELGIDISGWSGPLIEFLRKLPIIEIASFFAGSAACWLYLRLTSKSRHTDPYSDENEDNRPNIDTRLKLRLDGSGSKQFTEEFNSNVGAWRQTVVSFGGKGKSEKDLPMFHVDTLSMTFAFPFRHERPIVDAIGGNVGPYNYYPLGITGAVFQFYGPVQATELDIWFPPEGYYSKRSEANRQRFASHPADQKEEKLSHPSDPHA